VRIPKILSLGSINADFQARTGHALRAGETLLAHDFVRRAGGKAANVAFLAHRLGCHAELMGRVGDDDLREQALGPLRRVGLSIDKVTVAPGTATAVSMIGVAADGSKSIMLANNANDAWDEAAVAEMLGVIEAAPAGSLLVADCEVPPAIVAAAVSRARGCGLEVVLDPAPAERASADTLAQCTALTPDAREAGELTCEDATTVSGAAKAAILLSDLGVPLVCIKLSNGGCVFAEGKRLRHAPPVSVPAVDSTGAGDAFTGALAVALLEGKQTDSAVLFASAASHLAVTAYGSQESYPTRGQIEAFVPRLAARLHDMRL
jgi:ribokinase